VVDHLLLLLNAVVLSHLIHSQPAACEKGNNAVEEYLDVLNNLPPRSTCPRICGAMMYWRLAYTNAFSRRSTDCVGWLE
jgi:hypothetical protein